MNIETPNLSFSRSLTAFRQKITKLVCHHPDHPTWTIQDIHNYHRNRLGWVGIGYNYFITFDGRIQQGRGRNQGAHVSGHNHNTLGICFQGNFETQQMTDAQVKAGAWLLAKLIRDEGLTINDVIGHNDLAATACPGKNFRMNDLRQAILEELNPSVKESVKVDNSKPSEWATEAWNWATKEKITDGTRPKDTITREEVATMLYRYDQKNK